MFEIERLSADDEDFRQVLKLRYELLDEPVGAPEITEPSDNDRNPDNHNVAIYDGDRVVSAVRVDKAEDKEYVVRRMLTAKEYQRRGIGRYVMGVVEMFVAGMGSDRIRLNATPNAINFYESLGYSHTGEGVQWQDVYHPEMVKQLDGEMVRQLSKTVNSALRG